MPIRKIKHHLSKISHVTKQTVEKLNQSSKPIKAGDQRPLQVQKTDILYTLVELTAQKRKISVVAASYHPLINFFLKRREKISHSDEKNLTKVVANLESFLTQVNDPLILQDFYSFFASKQGLILFRSNIITLRYFSRMMVKLVDNKPQLTAVFKVLSMPSLLQVTNATLDQLLPQILSETALIGMDDEALQAWTLKKARE